MLPWKTVKIPLIKHSHIHNNDRAKKEKLFLKMGEKQRLSLSSNAITGEILKFFERTWTKFLCDNAKRHRNERIKIYKCKFS